MQEEDWLDVIRHALARWSDLGSIKFPDGCQLIGHVPHYAPEAYLHSIFRPLSEAELEIVERQIGKNLQPVLVSFLMRMNGLSIFSGAISLYGYRTSNKRSSILEMQCQPFDIIQYNLREKPKNLCSSDIAIGSYGDDCSKIIMCANQSIFRTERYDASCVLNRWGDLQSWLTCEVERLTRIFDADGRCTDENLILPSCDVVLK